MTSLHRNRRCHKVEHLPTSLFHMPWMSQRRFSTANTFWVLASGLSLPLALAEHSPHCGGHKDTHPHSPGFLHQLPVEGTGMEWHLVALYVFLGVSGVQGRTTGWEMLRWHTKVVIHNSKRHYLCSLRSCWTDGLKVWINMLGKLHLRSDN